ncbi:MAG: cation transporter [Chloroflexi bacterium]|jgi:copper chaperone CopZ|uniref:Heavy metal transporter n=1 Tax=Candidatus Thermofonsia Clade 3 bacterium TaxID=2364212 RepID=A0A2M8QDS3_9CHLR|nr:heavy-metal-associated domain-containing protein [Candidatus Roseilinea sp. NK_OTU-006]PJF47965.1 MAG: heavy metal transporter [Candidatus Thermofonsia Clade 3 bacterium]RMG65308.1 MAG: cation transporter [Chloroflexota bacterium]
MNTKTFRIPNIGCDGCARTIQNELKDLPGVTSVQADPATKMVTVTWDEPARWDAIREKLIAIHYPPE